MTTKIVVLALACVGLSSCAAQLYWVKPGASGVEAQRSLAECTAESYQRFPVQVPPPQAPAQSGPIQTTCTTQGNTTNCSSYSGGSFTVVPADLLQDQNMIPRQAALKACMYGRGYSLQRAQ